MRRRRKKLFILRLPWLLFFLALVIVFILELSLKPTIVAFAEAQANWTATEAIHNAVLEKVVTQTNYRDLIYLEKNANQQVVFMEPNLVKVARIQSEAVLAVQKALEKLANEKFSIPLGQVLGSKLLANYGPGIKLELVPVGTVQAVPIDEFEEAGINQTRHRIYLEIKSKVKVVIPFISSEVDVFSKVPIADAIIVGPVPKTYLQVNLEEGSLFKSLWPK
ncbi:sporulation protein YunB [Calderihabitans maritimus]|uniref:Sporulation protein YunB n=1 Tax=Calderihabitans maritimus TaxID=1246530 RepID=A0A1Z5HVF4_9FIRM|nr:sporulation protein YunB [Calderihabitans maritimus]GAW93519.1 sporulation protein YunB [Calderihabitans maritimus]